MPVAYSSIARRKRIPFKYERPYRLWTELEDKALISHIQKYGPREWPLAALAVGNGRSSGGCRIRYLNTLNPDLERGTWSKDEERILLEGVKQFGEDFGQIATLLPRRNAVQCRFRYSRIADKGKFKRGRFSKKEDECILNSVEKHGRFDPELIQAEMPYPREPLSIRYRWILLQNRRLSEAEAKVFSRFWTGEEDKRLVEAIEQVSAQLSGTVEFHGSRWKKIADIVGTKTEIQCYRRANYLEDSWNAGKALRADGVPVRTRMWTEEEKLKLKELVEKSREPTLWREIAKQLSGRTRMSTYFYYFRNVDPNVNHGHWSFEETERLWKGVQEHGKMWKKVSTVVKTRNHVQCRDEYELLTKVRVYHPSSYEDSESEDTT